MAGVVHILARLSPTKQRHVQTLLENLRIHCCYTNSEGPWYTKNGRAGKHRFLAEFIVDNSARNNDLAFAKSRAAFESANTKQHQQIIAGLLELRDAIWYCFIRDKLEDCFGDKYGFWAANLFDCFDKARRENLTVRLFPQTDMIDMFAKAMKDCVE
ncbi:hypothetical protein B0T14DRAFT_559119 [Immersiella caudata]|uniref:Uncharacterized protein n=1 Tax=Immersiella caudata TaxID=314043 RepID=A0AA39XCB6_9PEZI|nr:hypothetical protein B0T14DRAFT_559119 [Immersiella caudata]